MDGDRKDIKRSRSVIWDHFEKVPKSPGKAKCLICGALYQHSHNTSNLFKHLSTHHGGTYENAKQQKLSLKPSDQTMHKKQCTIDNLLPKKGKYLPESQKVKELDKLLLKMITTDLQPASIVEDSGFQKFVSGLDPRYELPSRRKIMRNMLPSEYNSAKASLKKLLEEIEDIALTTDIWTSRQTQTFMCVTAHFINSDWVLKSHVLETVQLKTAHTAHTIASELKRVAEEWSVENKIRMIVTDNASNMTRAVSLVGWRHIPCFAHTINLVVTNSISAIDSLEMLVKKVKSIVTFFHSSVKASDKLAEIQIQNKIPEHKLIQDVDTRWNSSFYMLERMLEQHDAVTTVLCLLGRNDLCLPVKLLKCDRLWILLDHLS